MRYCIIMLVLAYSLTSFAQIPLGNGTSADKMELLGDVKSIQETVYSNGQVEQNKFMYFNAEGNLISVKDSLGELQYSYNKRGQCTRMKMYNKKDYAGEVRYEYDKKGNNIKTIWTTGDYTLYKYDLKSSLIEEANFSKDGKCIQKSIFSYNAKIELIEKTLLGWSGDFVWKAKYTYDEKGDQTEVIFYDKNDKPGAKSVYVYNENGDKTEVRSYTSEGKLLEKTLYTYNRIGNKISEKHEMAENNVVFETKIEYDSYNNWIRKTTTRNGVADKIEERKIEYHLR